MIAITAGAVAVGGVALLSVRTRAKAVESVPKRMRRVVLVEANSDLKQARLEVQEVDTPKPRSGQVLVKMAAAPVNPSDDGIWKVPPRAGYPLPLGNEGSGRVVASGGGLLASRVLGKSVAVTTPGTYAEYVVANAMTNVFELPADVPTEDGCAFFVNPMTVVGIVDTAKSRGKALIHTAAASQLGQMMVKYCKQEGVTLVNVVRRREQVELLRGLGAEHIVCTGDEGWEQQLALMIKELKIRCAFDAVAGEMSGKLLTMLPPGGSVWIYGRLAPEPVGGIQPLDLVYRGKELHGFLLTSWLMKGGLLKAFFRSNKAAKVVRKHLKTVFASDFKDTTLSGMHKDYTALMATGMTGVKLRVRPSVA